MPRQKVIGVVGSGSANTPLGTLAHELGRLIAGEGWVVLSGGRNAGVMDRVSEGAKSAGGTTIGILPNGKAAASDWIDVAIVTDMNNARNAIIVLSSDVVIACGVEGAGTASEVALAIKTKKPVILLAAATDAEAFFKRIGGALVSAAKSAEDAVGLARTTLGASD